MKKKIARVLLLMIIVIGFTGCESNNVESSHRNQVQNSTASENLNNQEDASKFEIIKNGYFSYEVPKNAVDGKKYRQQPFTDRDYYIVPLEETTNTHDPYSMMIVYVSEKIAYLYGTNVSNMDLSNFASKEYKKWIDTGYSDGKNLSKYTITIDGQEAYIVEVDKGNGSKQIYYFFETPNHNPIYVMATADDEYIDYIKDKFVNSIEFIK